MPWIERMEDPPGQVLIRFDRTLAIGRTRGGVGFDARAIGPLDGRIDLQAGRYFLVGLKDPPTIRVNGRPVTAAPLLDGDELHIGEVVLRFRLAEEPAVAGGGARPPLSQSRPARLGFWIAAALAAAAAAVTGAALVRRWP